MTLINLLVLTRWELLDWKLAEETKEIINKILVSYGGLARARQVPCK